MRSMAARSDATQVRGIRPGYKRRQSRTPPSARAAQPPRCLASGHGAEAYCRAGISYIGWWAGASGASGYRVAFSQLTKTPPTASDYGAGGERRAAKRIRRPLHAKSNFEYHLRQRSQPAPTAFNIMPLIGAPRGAERDTREGCL